MFNEIRLNMVLTRGEMVMVHDALHDCLMWKLKELDAMEAQNGSEYDIQKMREYVDALGKLKAKFGST